MNEVKRYEPFVHSSGGDYWPEMEESKSGDYVSYKDYKELLTAYKELQQSPAVAVHDEPKNPGAAYLQTFLNDSRFDQVVNSMPDDLIQKFHSRIVERTTDRDDWKMVCENLEEDIAKLSPSPHITKQYAKEIIESYLEFNTERAFTDTGIDSWLNIKFSDLLDKLNKEIV